LIELASVANYDVAWHFIAKQHFDRNSFSFWVF